MAVIDLGSNKRAEAILHTFLRGCEALCQSDRVLEALELARKLYSAPSASLYSTVTDSFPHHPPWHLLRS